VASSKEFSRAKSENNSGSGKEESVREEKKQLPGWRVGVCFYSPSVNFTRIWRVGEWLSVPLLGM
jgi:hypothetical protein